MKPKQQQRLFIATVSCFALSFIWGIVSSRLFPGDRTILWAGLAVLWVVLVFFTIVLRYLPIK